MQNTFGLNTRTFVIQQSDNIPEKDLCEKPFCLFSKKILLSE
jgi:hypothetical protein